MSLVGVFMAGANVAMNLVVMMYGVPEHYEASPGKIIFALLLAAVFGASALDKKR